MRQPVSTKSNITPEGRGGAGKDCGGEGADRDGGRRREVRTRNLSSENQDNPVLSIYYHYEVLVTRSGEGGANHQVLGGKR